jgi:hypothetical protein
MVNTTFTSADKASLAQPVQITNILQCNGGHPPADGTTHQVEEDHDGHGNEVSGGDGWGSGSTPHVFLQSSGDSYCATRAIHDTKVRDLQRKIDEDVSRSTSLKTEVQSWRTATKDLQSSLDAANSELNSAKSEPKHQSSKAAKQQSNNAAT